MLTCSSAAVLAALLHGGHCCVLASVMRGWREGEVGWGGGGLGSRAEL